jgi:ATP-dependent RNA helicase DDX3X
MENKVKGKYLPPHKRLAQTDTQPSKFEAFLNKKNTELADTPWGKRDKRTGLLDSKVLEDTEILFKQVKDVSEFDEDFPVDTSEDFPEMSNFDDCEVHPCLLANIKRLKYSKPTPIQKFSIPVSLQRRDLMACAQTGSGKTAAYLFPIVAKMLNDGPPTSSTNIDYRSANPIGLVLAPTRELGVQIYEEGLKFTYRTGIKVVVVYGGTDPKLQSKELEKGADIIVATPGRLIDFTSRGRIGLQNVKYLVLDEADRMLDMGFEPQIRLILEKLPEKRETGMFSATFPQTIQYLAAELMTKYVFLSVGRVGSTTDNITQELFQVDEMEKNDLLITKLKEIQGLVVVFVETKRNAEFLSEFLKHLGFACTTMHGNRTQQERERALNDFKTGRFNVLVATDIAARGLDVMNIGCVINYDMPSNINDYVHRIGRTGRIGKKGLAISFIDEKCSHVVKDLYSLLCETKQNIPEWFEDYFNNQAFRKNRNKRGFRHY